LSAVWKPTEPVGSVGEWSQPSKIESIDPSTSPTITHRRIFIALLL
jgi:hypothetical protein